MKEILIWLFLFEICKSDQLKVKEKKIQKKKLRKDDRKVVRKDVRKRLKEPSYEDSSYENSYEDFGMNEEIQDFSDFDGIDVDFDQTARSLLVYDVPIQGQFRPFSPPVSPPNEKNSDEATETNEKKPKIAYNNKIKDKKIKLDNKKSRQLLKLMKLFDPKFQEAKFFSYGCNCFLKNDTYQNPGFGEAIDELDDSCKKYKECLEDARNEFGQDCRVEENPYR